MGSSRRAATQVKSQKSITQKKKPSQGNLFFIFNIFILKKPSQGNWFLFLFYFLFRKKPTMLDPSEEEPPYLFIRESLVNAFFLKK